MNFKTSEIEQEETLIDLTPLIDVVFLLLIFFMVSTSFVKPNSLKIALPDSEQGDESNETRIIEVYINENSNYAVAAGQDKTAKALLNSSRLSLLKALKAKQTDAQQVLIIRADKNAPHEAVIKVMDVAQDLGLTNISFATQKIKD